MTTHPYPQQPPAQAYPTAPPWAVPPPGETPQAPSRGTAIPYGAPYPQHGQLLVPYPEEMAGAARPQPPAWWPVVVWTFFFSVLGALSASRRAGQARHGRNSVAPYWVAWAVTVVAGSAISVAVVVVGVPAYLDYRETLVTRVVQDKVRADDQVRAAANGAAVSAVCEPVGARDQAGRRVYDCALALDNGRSGSLRVVADADGDWTAVRPK